MKKISILLLIFFSYCLESCNNSEQFGEKLLSVNRSKFINENDTKDKQKRAFSVLTFEQQRDLWLDKLNQVRYSKNTPKELYYALGEVCNVLKVANNEGEIIHNAKLVDNAIKIASMLSKQAYGEIFSNLADYHLSTKLLISIKNNLF